MYILCIRLSKDLSCDAVGFTRAAKSYKCTVHVRYGCSWAYLIHACIHITYIYMYVHTCMCSAKALYMRRAAHKVYIYIYTHIYMHIYIYICTCIYMHIYIYICARVCLYVCVCVYTSIYIYIYIYIYIHICICTYMYMGGRRTFRYGQRLIPCNLHTFFSDVRQMPSFLATAFAYRTTREKNL